MFDDHKKWRILGVCETIDYFYMRNWERWNVERKGGKLSPSQWKKNTKNSSNLFMNHLNYSCWRPRICTFQRRQVMKRLTKQPFNQQVFLFVTKSNIRCIHTANFSLCFLFIRCFALYIYVSNPIFSCRNPGELM